MAGQALLIYGSREYARLVAQLAADCGVDVTGFIDDQRAGPGIVGSYADALRRYPRDRISLAIGVGYSDLAARRALLQRCTADGWTMPGLIHPRAVVHPSATCLPASIVMMGAIVDVKARVGLGAVCWPGSVVSHDSALGDNSFLSPNATLCGFVTTGESCFFGAASVVPDHRDVPGGTFLKAGACFGGPARPA